MTDVEELDVHLWVGDQERVVTYTVSVEGGIRNTDEAVEEAIERAEDDGHRDLNLKEVEPVSDADG